MKKYILVLGVLIVLGFGGGYLYNTNIGSNTHNPLPDSHSIDTSEVSISILPNSSDDVNSEEEKVRPLPIKSLEQNENPPTCDEFNVDTHASRGTLARTTGVITFGDCVPSYNSNYEDQSHVEPFVNLQIVVEVLKEKYPDFYPIIKIYSLDEKLIYQNEILLDTTTNILESTIYSCLDTEGKKVNNCPSIYLSIDIPVKNIGPVGEYTLLLIDKSSGVSRSGDFKIIYPRFIKHDWSKNNNQLSLIERSGGNIILSGDAETYKTVEAVGPSRDYFIFNNKVYFISYDYVNEEIIEVQNADPETFGYLSTCMAVEKYSDHYYRDKNNIYAGGKIISEDSENFEIIGQHIPEQEISGTYIYARDSTNVYTACGDIVPDADPETYKIPDDAPDTYRR